MTEKASGALPPDHPLFAPLIKRRPRIGRDARYWMPLPGDIARGFPIKLLTFTPDMSEEEVAAECRRHHEGLKLWRAGIEGPTTFSVAWLIKRYRTDKFSPYQKIGFRSQVNYAQCLKIIEQDIGKVRIDPDGLIPGITSEDVWEFHEVWGAPVEKKNEDGTTTTGAPRASRARHLITQFRMLIKYAVIIGVPGAKDLHDILKEMEFPTTPARLIAPDYAQVMAIVDKAVEMGFPSIAATTLAQFELTERRISILGSWERGQWRPGWVWQNISEDWNISYTQNKVGIVVREYDLKDTPRLLELLQRTPKDKQVGPVMVCEKTKLPWREKHYTDTWRKIARAAGIPDEVCSMDMRAGGATETDQIAAVTDRMMQDSGGWREPKTKDRYRRNKQRNAQNVVRLRQENRRSPP